MEEKKFCKNHPDKTAHRKCYHCKQPICPECQHHYENHIFCGKKCYYVWKSESILNRVKPYKQLVWFVLIVLLSDLIIILIMSGEYRKSIKESYAPALFRDSSIAEIPYKADELVQGNKIVFTLTIPQGRVIALVKNGQFVKTEINKYARKIEMESSLDIGQNVFKLYAFSESEKARLIDSVVVSYYSKRLEFLARPVYRINTSKKITALTFDGGSLDNGALSILDTLKKYNVKCTMFLTGGFIRHYPALVKRIIADGHEVGNHSYSHPHLTHLEINGSTKTLETVNYTMLQKQLYDADSVFNRVSGGHFAPLWRAPYGEVNGEIIRWAAQAGYKHIGWSDKCDTWDWVADTTSKIYRNNIEILARLLMVEDKYGLNGKIILMHLATERGSERPYEILGEIIRKLRRQGYRFVTISELINAK